MATIRTAAVIVVVFLGAVCGFEPAVTDIEPLSDEDLAMMSRYQRQIEAAGDGISAGLVAGFEGLALRDHEETDDQLSPLCRCAVKSWNSAIDSPSCVALFGSSNADSRVGVKAQLPKWGKNFRMALAAQQTTTVCLACVTVLSDRALQFAAKIQLAQGTSRQAPPLANAPDVKIDNWCNENHFCRDVCPDYVGPADVRTRSAAACDTSAPKQRQTPPSNLFHEACTAGSQCLLHMAHDAGLIAGSSCLRRLTSVNQTCDSAMSSLEWSLATVHNLYCAVNKNGNHCIETINTLFRVLTSGGSTCADITSVGCCFQSYIDALLEVGDTDATAHASKVQRIGAMCNFAPKSCPLEAREPVDCDDLDDVPLPPEPVAEVHDHDGDDEDLATHEDDSSAQGRKSKRIGAIVGVALAFLVVLVLAIVVTATMVRRRTARQFEVELQQRPPQAVYVQPTFSMGRPLDLGAEAWPGQSIAIGQPVLDVHGGTDGYSGGAAAFPEISHTLPSAPPEEDSKSHKSPKADSKSHKSPKADSRHSKGRGPAAMFD
eukprot:CAMPEP_0114539742 /NCGR_PEP_ID=MMETSP0114-20121206/400_1 /TAXON_ID=31324 /ORGANISM="Goniomonas sp, Strain m" /LENGTH=544 /DNA_ID=CAMNT_0001723865 /DNA_START=20 /DNA_END=1654 /DNA_ORIENTATION=+